MAYQETELGYCQTNDVFANPETLFEVTKFDDENIGHNFFDPLIVLSRRLEVAGSKILRHILSQKNFRVLVCILKLRVPHIVGAYVTMGAPLQ